MSTDTTLDLFAPGALAALFARNRALYGDSTMSADAGDGGGSEGADADAGENGGSGDGAGADGTDGSTPAPSKVEDLPDWAQKIIRTARKDAGDSRAAKAAAEQQQRDAIAAVAKTLGLAKDDAPVDPAALQTEITKREETIASLTAAATDRDVELAAWRSAARQQVNASTLLDSRAFIAEVAKLDPADDGFTAAIDAVIKKAADANPALRLPLADAPANAGIGTRGGTDDANVTPGIARLSRGYSNNK